VQFHALDAQQIVATTARLRDRIRERFPDANLGQVAGELLTIASAHAARSESIRRPNWLLRLVSLALVLCAVVMLATLVASARLRVGEDWDVAQLLQTVEAALSMLFFLGAGAVFTLTLDTRQKRRRCIEALHELRAMAHIVDMHQLTKDPERALPAGPATSASPERSLSPFETMRYLDYCSEMLSLMGKIAAAYVQHFPDPQAVSAVDDIENLTNGLSRKIWQKIMILDAASRAADAEKRA